MSKTEIIAVSFYILSIVLTIRKNIWLWPFGIIAEVCYLKIFFDEKLYADTGLQVIYLFQSIYGWYFWTRGLKEKEIAITLMSFRAKLYTAGATVAITGISYFVLHKYTDATVPFWDSLAASLSIAASWLLARRIFENWIFWIIADLIYIGLFAYKGLYLSSGIYLVFVFLSVAGLIKWNKELSAKKAFS
jgi:nicotinamide mononucleotide transporter